MTTKKNGTSIWMAFELQADILEDLRKQQESQQQDMTRSLPV